MLKLVQMWIKLQIRAKIRGKGGLGFFRLAIGFRKCLMPHDCCSFRGDIQASNSALARVALIEFLGLFVLIGANEEIDHPRQIFTVLPPENVWRSESFSSQRVLCSRDSREVSGRPPTPTPTPTQPLRKSLDQHPTPPLRPTLPFHFFFLLPPPLFMGPFPGFLQLLHRAARQALGWDGLRLGARGGGRCVRAEGVVPGEITF